MKAHFGGADGDSLYFSAGTQTSASIAGGGGNDTMVFNDTVGGTLFVSLDSGADSSTSNPGFWRDNAWR